MRDLEAAKIEAAATQAQTNDEEMSRLAAQLSNVPNLLQEIESLRAELAASPTAAETEELVALRLEVERLHGQERVIDTEVDLDRTLVEARRILDDARAEGERERQIIIDAAHHHAEEIIRRAQRQFSTESWEVEKIRLERRRYLSTFKSLISRHLHEVEQLEKDGLATEVVEPNDKLPQYDATLLEPANPFSRDVTETELREPVSREFRSPFTYPQADEPFRA